MNRRRLTGGFAVALAVALAAPVTAEAASSNMSASGPGTGHAAATDTAAARTASSTAPKPGANTFRTSDGRQYAVPAPALSINGSATVTPRATFATTSGPTLYVDDRSSACSDTAVGAGTQVVPFCTLQAAGEAVVPGDTVLVTPGIYTPFTITAHGTAAEPIVFEPSVPANVTTNPSSLYSIIVEPPLGTASAPAHAIDVEGSSYLDLDGFRVNYAASSDAVLIDTSQNVAMNDLMDWVAYGENTPQTAPDVHVTGDSTGISLTRDTLFNDYGQPYVQVDSGGSDDVIADDAFWGNDVVPVVVAGTPDTEITGNSFLIGASTAISLTASPDATIADNIVSYNGFSGDGGESVEVDPGSTSGTTLDYNLVEALGSGAYEWGGTAYASAAALQKGAGQAAHDINATADDYVGGDVLMLDSDSPAIDSANAAAPGEQATDVFGQSCVYDPSYSVTGAGTPAYCSRGSFQYQDPLTGLVTATASGSTSVDADATQSHGAQGISGYSFDFGDGSAAVVNTTGVAKHTYAHSGEYSVTVTVTDSTGATSTSADAMVTTAGSDFTAVSPVRVLDTRNGTGLGTAHKLGAGFGIEFPIPVSNGVVPQAVALNLTVTNATGDGYVDVNWTTSSVNYAAGQTIAGMVIAPVQLDDGQFTVILHGAGSGSIDLIADMTGFFATASPDGYQPIAPYRLVDTRNGTGGRTGLLTSADPDVVTVAGADGSVIPGSGVTAVAVNITVADATGGGFVSAYPDGTTNPGTSNINFGKSQIIANFAVVPVGADGKIDLADPAPGSTDVIVDVVGYFSADATSAFVGVNPYRAIDTRNGAATYGCDPAKGALSHDAVLATALTCANAGYPASDFGDITAVAATATVTQDTAPGYLTTYPAGGTMPTSSDLDWQHGGQTIANLTFAGTGTSGEVDFANESSGSTQLVVDVYGFFANS